MRRSLAARRSLQDQQALRQSDWRFLLALPPTGDASGAGARLAVLSSPRAGDFRRAVAGLMPGGACYVEWGHPRLGGAWRVRWELQRAGLSEPECYWMWPPPRWRPARVWLPLPSGAVAPYFLAWRLRKRKDIRHPMSRGLGGLWRLGGWLGVLAPMCGLGWKPGAADYPGSLSNQIRLNWDRWGLGPAPRQVRCLMFAGGIDKRNKLTVLAFADGLRKPSVVVKLARTPLSEPGLAREAAVLDAIKDSPIAKVAAVPGPIFCGQLGGTFAVVETAVEGRELWTVLTRSSFPLVANQLADTLAALVPKDSAEDRWARSIAPVVTEFESRFGEVLNRDDLARQVQKLKSLPPLPGVIEHRDCSPWNLMVTSRGRLAFLDWESAVPDGLPALDLAYFLVNGAFLIEGVLGTGRERASYAGLLAGSPTGAVVEGALARYRERAELPPGVIAPLRSLAWMVHACVEYDRVRLDYPGLGSRGWASRSLYLALWLEEARAG
jgi:Phosphotransferase enzyme family